MPSYDASASPHRKTARPTVAKEDDPDLGRLRVLLAEDNIINQKLAIGVLSKYGHEVTVADNGEEAVRALEKWSV